jgi:GcrA cell cycle regulator
MAETGNGQSSRAGRWPDELVARLKELWPDYEASQIAAIFRMTRNAIIGKANRLGLAQKKRPAKRTKQPYRPAAKFYPKPQYFPPQQPPPVIMPELPFLNRTIEELAPGECRYPSGERVPYLFCGQPVQHSSSYCAHHHRLVYYPLSPSRRELYRPMSEWRGVG